MDPAQARLLDPVIAVHAIAALLAVALGAYLVAARKGTGAHRLAGRGFVAAMVVTAAGSFLIDAHLMPVHTPLGAFGPIHGLSAVMLVTLARAVAAARRGDVRVHRRAMLAALASLAIAGAFTLAPGRTLNAWAVALWG